jgi:hypothetical protein
MLAATMGLAIVAQMTAATVSIDFQGDSALVEARYDAVVSADSLGFTLIRLSDQSLRLAGVDGGVLEPTAGLYRLRAPLSNGEGATIRYVVGRDLSRIPIAVPDIAPPLDGASVSIYVSGLSRDAALDEGFPRLLLLDDGSASARLESLPGLLRVPPDLGHWSVSQMADASVALLVVFATVFWFYRRQAARRQSASRR